MVALVTVTYRSADALEAMLASVARASDAPVLSFVADNLPGTDDAKDVAERAGADYRAMPGNLGYGGAVNEVVRGIPDGVEWLLVTNPDVVFDEGSIDEMVAIANADSRIGAVGPLIRNEDGTAYPSARPVPGLGVGTGHAVFGPVWPANPWTRRYHAANAVDHERDAGWLSGACLLVRRSAFDDIGGFDSEFFMYFEDVDFGARLGRAGWRNRFTPTASVVHTGGHSTSAESSAMIAAHHRSAQRFIAKTYPGLRWWPVRASLALGLRLRERLARRLH
ncbi:glycosyltransferase family 2 protein [Agromyces agglutinans]|nr:glycosyltransferase family 2 protein [Agromyces agglutinans]